MGKEELFLETRAGNDAGATLNTDKLLESICKLDERCMTSDHQDCQEFLIHLRNGLIEEELLERLPDVQKDVRTVVDSIFRGEVSIMWTYKRCLHTADKDEEFYELSLPLPLPPKKHPTKSVPASQRSGRRKTADTVRRYRQIQKEGKFTCFCT
jgi:ubiquitin carboxyl-terminal hydrolase 16/45